MEYTIDATGKTLGRIATEAASVLLGKNTPSVKKNVVANVTVRVTHASAMRITEKKKELKTYHSHSGYPGSDRATKLSEVITKQGYGEALKRAVSGMTPKNTLREKRLKRLIVEE